MNYSPALEAFITEKNISKKEILYLTILNSFLQDIRNGDKNVEYRDLTDFYLQRFFKKNAQGKYAEPKKITHLLLQCGYSANSPRMLIQLNGIDKFNYWVM